MAGNEGKPNEDALFERLYAAVSEEGVDDAASLRKRLEESGIDVAKVLAEGREQFAGFLRRHLAMTGSVAQAPTSTGISSPAATGGAGTFFEQQVGAWWLAHLLVRGIPPILPSCTLAEVHFQTERLGWKTDDFLVITESASGDRRRLVGQVKRSFTVSATNEACKKAFQDFWYDFTTGGQFSPADDRFVLVTLRGTTALLEHFTGLLACAQAARDGAEFELRLATPGFVDAKVRRHAETICSIVGDIEGRKIEAAEIWSFVRLLYVLSLDLTTSTAQSEVSIKNLLAHTTQDRDPVGAAAASWSTLLEEASKAIPEARSYAWMDLPGPLRDRHARIGTSEQRVLQALSDHTALVLNGIRGTIGADLHLGRDRLVQTVGDQLASMPVLLLTGPAGSGKSAVAKDVAAILATDHFVFGFRAEEFAAAHLDEVLARNQVPANGATIGAILAGQARKVMLVESVERLLEASTRDAFTDLLKLATGDKSWRVILTCRDYSSDIVRSAFLTGIDHAVVSVPALDDAELAEVVSEYPALDRVLAHPSLRALLRNPYMLDKALQIPWPEDKPLPDGERELRARFWREVVKAEQHASGGLPREREVAFVDVALRRARSLTLYVACDDLDPDIVQRLRLDSLVASSPQSDVLLAPAHDVLEDWAILEWLQERHATRDGSTAELVAAVGGFPAIRRSYRKWVGELIEYDAAAADDLFRAAVTDATLPQYFRDDTLVALLRSPAAVAFLERHRADLFADDKSLLRRVIHLLRVACVTVPAWSDARSGHGSLFNVPDGSAWACVLGLIRGNLATFAKGDLLLLLGFIDDWARGVTWQTPYPEGAEAVAAVSHWLVPQFDYRSDDERERTLKIIAKIPNADRDRFINLLAGGDADERQDRVTDELQDLVFQGIEGISACRDVPDVVVREAKRYLFCTEADLRDELGFGASHELEPLFGIKMERSFDFQPPSAYHGFFLPLLRHHPAKGLAFIIELVNHSAAWYAHPRVPVEHVEPPFEITLTFADGSSRTQWANARLWGLHRGMSVGPDALQTALMALEHWLLEMGEVSPKSLDRCLMRLLETSESAAMTAVVASVATAFPHLSGETLLVLLRSRECVQFDRDRLTRQATQPPSAIFSLFPRLDAGRAVYEEERKQSDARPHRRLDLESAILNVQLGPLATRVHAVLEEHSKKLPDPEAQTDEDRVWRLALHRMDLRRYDVARKPTVEMPAEREDPSKRRKRVELHLSSPETDLQSMVEESTARHSAMNARMELLVWGMQVFEGKQGAHETEWRPYLQRARVDAESVGSEEIDPMQGGPAYVAAVCIRDHWDEMTADDRTWCAERVAQEIDRQSSNWNHIARVQRHAMSGDRPAALALPALLGKELPPALRKRALRSLITALSHPVDEVRDYVAAGIGRHLWSADRTLALRCVNALAMQATLVQEAFETESGRPFNRRRSVDALEAAAAVVIQRAFVKSDGIDENAHEVLDGSRWFGAEASQRILSILGRAPTEPVATGAFERLARTLVGWWDADDEDRGRARQERNFECEITLRRLLEDLLLQTSEADATTILGPILEAMNRHPKEVASILEGLILAEDRRPNTGQFWALWQRFADRVQQADWLADIDEEHADGREVVDATFLGRWWKEDVRHWRSLDGYAERVHGVFDALPRSSTVLYFYVRFLYRIGEQSLPTAFIRVTRKLKAAGSVDPLQNGNTVFMLEALLQRYVYGKPLELKRVPELRAAVLGLLDMLVESGSSAAFRMRDDFVTPAHDVAGR